MKTVYEKLYIAIDYSRTCLQNKRVRQYSKLNRNIYRLVEDTLLNVGDSMTLHTFNTENQGMMVNIDCQLDPSLKDTN